MSLHAQTSPEAQAILAAQKRNSTIASIIIGILIMALLALIFYWCAVTIFTDKTEPMVAFSEEIMEEEII